MRNHIQSNLFAKNLPLYALIITIIVSSFIIYRQHNMLNADEANIQALMQKQLGTTASIIPTDAGCEKNVNQIRLKDYQFTKPLVLSETSQESVKMKGLKEGIETIIQSNVNQGKISSGSVYIRRMNKGGWICVNGNEPYGPGSLIKVPVLITYLKMQEKNPGILDLEIYFDKKGMVVPNQTFDVPPIESGKKYKVRELLYYMIVNSDNFATMLLNENMDIPTFNKVFTDLGIAEPDVHDPNFKITASDFSRFMRILYNGTYLMNASSEFALSLLVETKFKEGLIKDLPKDVRVAHKFGEKFAGGIRQLHESGIVYAGDDTYVITIMTKGRDMEMLPKVISDISKYAFEHKAL